MMFYFLGINLLIIQVSCSTWDAVKLEHEKLSTAYSINNADYYTDILPTSDFTVPLEVSLRMEMTSLGGYDAVNGAIDIIGSLSMSWTDEIGTLSSERFDSSVASEMLVDYRKLWTPVIVLINSADSVQRVGDSAYKVRFNVATGRATWRPRVIIKASCTPDVSFFPFDEQKCTLTVAPWFLPKDVLKLNVSSDSWNMDHYDKNGVWNVDSTESSAFISGNFYYASFTINFKREPLFFTINLVLPILFLSLLSGCVFLLPAASGERVGFVITCFLTFVILLQTTMTYLPQASAPMSLLCYYVIVMMVFSAFLSLINAFLLRIYHKPKGEEVPRWLIHAIEIIKCIKCRRMKCPKKSSSVDNSSESSQMGLHYSEKSRTAMPARSSFHSKRSTTIVNVKEAEMANSKLEKNTSQRIAKDTARNTHEENELLQAKTKHGILPDKAGYKGPIKGGLKGDGITEDTITDSEADDLGDIDWDSVGRLLDNFFILVFIGVQCAFSIFFLVPIGSRA